jgi:hypothetical protein
MSHGGRDRAAVLLKDKLDIAYVHALRLVRQARDLAKAEDIEVHEALKRGLRDRPDLLSKLSPPEDPE